MGLGADKKEWIQTQDILTRLEVAFDDRGIPDQRCHATGRAGKTIHKLTLIDPWFLKQIKG